MAVSQQGATDQAVRFLELVKGHLELTPEQLNRALGAPVHETDDHVGPLWEFETSLGLVAVSGTTGEVVSYEDVEDLEELEARVSMVEAEEAMRKFLQAVFPEFDESRYELVEKDSVDGRFHFTFEQVRKPGEESIFHNFLAVSLRGDIPRVISYDRSDLNFVRKTPPKLTEAKAREIIQELAGADGRISEMHLFEHPLEHGARAVTVWAGSIVYESGGLESLDMIMVNADTGEPVPVEEE